MDKCEQAHQDVQTYVDWGIDYIKVDSCKNYNASSFNTTIPLISGWFVLYACTVCLQFQHYDPSHLRLVCIAVVAIG